MRKNGFTIIEVVFVFLLILATTFLILPRSLNSTKQARYISKWSETYSKMEYVYSVIKAQNEEALAQKFLNAKNNEIREAIVIDTIKPYLRIKSGVETCSYKQLYKSKVAVLKGDKYYFYNFYLTDDGEIVGLKWFAKECTDDNICGVMAFDVNGEEEPNTWGEDVFGLNVYNNRIEPIGKHLSTDILKTDCSKIGTGVDCSYYYLIGGEFE